MRIQQHAELDVYKKAFDAAMLIFEGSKMFPKEETYSLTEQIRRCLPVSLSPCLAIEAHR